MAHTKNYMFPLLSGEDALIIKVKEWAETINGVSDDSAINKIDVAIKVAEDKVDALKEVARTGEHSDLAGVGTNTHEQIDEAIERLKDTGGVNTGDQTDITGNASTADKLKTSRDIEIVGDVAGQCNFDGSGDVQITAKYKKSGVASGTYKSVTVDDRGIVTDGANPTTLSGYGITDAATNAQGLKADSAIQFAKVGSQAVVKENNELLFPPYPETLSPSGNAGGDLSGEYPNPILNVNNLQNKVLTYTQASERVNLISGTDTLSTVFGKLTKWFLDLKTVAFSGDFSDIQNTPTTIAGYKITDAVNINEKGAANGVATLDSNKKVPVTQLPSYVDDVLEFELFSQLPVNGESGKIYIIFNDDKKINGQYRWTGTVYSKITQELDYATQAEAIAGVENTKVMTALRVKEATSDLATKTDAQEFATAAKNEAVTIASSDATIKAESSEAAAKSYMDEIAGTKADSNHIHNYAGSTTSGGAADSAVKFATVRTVDGVSFDGSTNIAHYATCSTDAAADAKAVALAGFALVTGAEITVKFTVTNTAASPTLNVNSTGAKPIYYRGEPINTSYLAANRTYRFSYDGTSWNLIGDIDTNTTYEVATTSANGLMSKDDKTKLDSLAVCAWTYENVIALLTSMNNLETLLNADRRLPFYWQTVEGGIAQPETNVSVIKMLTNDGSTNIVVDNKDLGIMLMLQPGESITDFWINGLITIRAETSEQNYAYRMIYIN